MSKLSNQKLFSSEPNLYRFCDFLASQTQEPIAAFFLADGTVRVGFGQGANAGQTRFIAQAFDPTSATKKTQNFWEQEATPTFFPKHLILGRLGEEFSVFSKSPAEFEVLWGQAVQQKPVHSKEMNWRCESDKASWTKLCDDADIAIHSGKINKLVPARFLHLIPENGFVFWNNYFSALREKSGKNTHRFLWRNGRQVFFGASPELLFRLEKNALQVPAIAGTRPHRGDSAEAADELFSSDKEAREHAVVVRDIIEQLKKLGLKPEAPEKPQILSLPGLIHLHTPIHAKFENAPPLASILSALHPTPAMGGHPREEAREFLANREHWNRGYYAAPLGFVDEDGSGAMIVGIRSALFSQERISLFAGAGYVAGSDAESEWQETEAKLQSMLGVFGL